MATTQTSRESYTNAGHQVAGIVAIQLEEYSCLSTKEEFQHLLDYVCPAWAGKFIDQWTTKVMRSKIEPMKREAKTIRRHKDLILNWFIAKKAVSSGVLEGLNTKVKLTVRKSYGFRTYHAAETALYHALGALPVPETAHKFS
jgi:transposase